MSGNCCKFTVARVCQKFAEIHQEQKTPLAAIKLLKIAITKLRPNSESLTPLHADFLQTCLLAKDYRAALPVLSDEVLALANPESYNLKARDVLRFFYYGGMIYTGVKNFGKALEFFKMVSATHLVELIQQLAHLLLSLTHTLRVSLCLLSC